MAMSKEQDRKKDLSSVKRIYNETNKYKAFNQIIKKLYKELCEEDEVDEKNSEVGSISIVPKIIYDSQNKSMEIEFYFVNEKCRYRLKNLIQFYDAFALGKSVRYNAKMEFKHVKSSFDNASQKKLDFLLKYSEIIKYTNDSIGQHRYYGKVMNESCVTISNTCLDELFDVFKGEKIDLKKDYVDSSLLFLDEEPDLKFFLDEGDAGEYKLSPNIDIYEYDVLDGKKFVYFVKDSVIYRCDKSIKNNLIKLLDFYKENFVNEVYLKKSDISKLFSLVVPYIKKYFEIRNVDLEELKKLIPEELGVKVYLDFDKNDFITADIKFVYDKLEINPFNDNQVQNKIPRDVIKETKTLEKFMKYGFLFDKKNSRLILTDEEKIYNFLAKEILSYTKNYEVFVTDTFKSKEVKQPKIGNIGVKIENNLLQLDLGEFNFSEKELANVMEAYKLRKKFIKLKDGNFLDLTPNESLEFLERLDIDGNLRYDQIANSTMQMPIYRGLYLDKILENLDTNIYKGKEFRAFVNDLNENNSEYDRLPEGLNATLRRYQEVGFNWLRTLEKYGLGGILADDMGLGKTIQIIALLLEYKNKNKNRRANMVVCPSSLALNWFSEIKKFAPRLNAVVIAGNANERRKIIDNIKKYDVIICSYDLLKRDIEIYDEKKYEFKYIIADEAQYIKNNNTQNFKAIKRIRAQTRFALTGTPIENSLAELWSIFDFCMPGYLYGYRKFKENFETPIVRDEDAYKVSKLKMLIEPFILRRLKEAVLTELPEKIVTVLDSEMDEEQEKIYLSYMASAREEVANELKISGFSNNQMRILALLMRLRQICCHPKLFLENYKGESGKLNQCMEIIKDAVEGNHKILLFSGYTSMLEIIERKLEKEGIKYFKLTGQTKVNERLNLVDEFNENEEIKVFLISLKSGGTGLNLVGADMVIHYDPWWNISAENQATDRTYRIGQKRNVQVYKLITKNSIEEKIYELQQRKAKLIDNMLSTNETFISKLSQEEIMELFK